MGWVLMKLISNYYDLLQYLPTRYDSILICMQSPAINTSINYSEALLFIVDSSYESAEKQLDVR